MAFGNMNPAGGFFGQLAQIREQNPTTWNTIAASMLAGPTFRQGIQQAAQVMPQAMQADRQHLEQARQKNATVAWAKAQGLDPATLGLIEANPPLALELFKSKMGGGNPTDDMREYQMAKSQGFDGTFFDYLKAMKSAGGTTVNVGPNGTDYGKPDDGTVWQRDQQGNIVLDERGAPIAIPYQGGKAYNAQKSAADAAGRKQVQNDIVLQDIDYAMSQIGKGKALGGLINTTTGLLGGMSEDIPGSPAKALKGTLNTIKANIGFDQLTAMRAASPTGAALGSITERENILLQSVLGDLEQSSGEEQITRNLKRLKNVYLDIVHGPGNGPPRENVGGGAPVPVGGAQAAPAAAPSAKPGKITVRPGVTIEPWSD